MNRIGKVRVPTNKRTRSSCPHTYIDTEVFIPSGNIHVPLPCSLLTLHSVQNFCYFKSICPLESTNVPCREVPGQAYTL